MLFSFTLKSSNSKTGPIPVTGSQSITCPSACPLQGNGCYAAQSFTGIRWRQLDNGKGIGIEELTAKISKLPKGQLWRHNVFGDLPGNDGLSVNVHYMHMLVNANQGKRGFTYTHYDCINNSSNAEMVRMANKHGFTVNLSANSPEHADALSALSIGPVVTLLNEDAPKLSHTPQGRPIVVCPAVTNDDVTCATCGLCQKVDRKSIVGFPVHGSGKNKARKVITIHTTKG